MTKKIPTVYGKVIKKHGGNMLFQFRCDYCKTKHTHGWTDDPQVTRHRVAHCADDESPYDKTGYFIAKEPSVKTG